IIKLLIRYGAYINRYRYTIGRLLTYAVQKGCKSLVRYLLNKGADINAQSLVSLLIVTYNKGHYNIIEYLINRGANINARTNYRSPLSRAYVIGHKNIILLLI
ncbi:ankyrin repeat-containing domain protein, partial [Cenococcum geophilum]